MLNEDEPPPPSPLLPRAPLDRMGVGELEGYIAGLRGEIARAEAEIGRKRALRDAADSVFRKP